MAHAIREVVLGKHRNFQRISTLLHGALLQHRAWKSLSLELIVTGQLVLRML